MTEKLAHDSQSPLQRVGGDMFHGAPPILFEFARELRNKPTEAESYLWNFLSNNKLNGMRFKRQHPILYFIADFYCHKAKLIIEIDGGYHQIPEQYLYDKNRDSELEEFGLKTIRFTNKQVLFETEQVLNMIKDVAKNRLGTYLK